MNLPEGFENMTPVRRALEVARHELVTLHGLIVADGAAPNETFEINTSGAVALLDKVLEQMAKKTDREALRAQLLAFVERVSGENLDKKTPEEVQILPEIASLLTTVFHL